MNKCAVIGCENLADPRWFARDVNGHPVEICDGHPAVSPGDVEPVATNSVATSSSLVVAPTPDEREATGIEFGAGYGAMDEDRERLSNLATNLRIAGALCDAFNEGFALAGRLQLYERFVERDWRPGCGRPMPGTKETP